MTDPMQYLSNADLARFIESFSKYLMCWKVNRQFGSQLSFDMGPMFEQQIKPGVSVPGGSSTLVLEGYDWKIFDGKRNLIADSETVSDEIVREKLDPIFLKSTLGSVRFNQENRELFVEFSNHLLISSSALTSGEYIDDNLCLWVLPDGRVLSCDAHRGFYWDGSVSQEHRNITRKRRPSLGKRVGQKARLSRINY